MATAATACLPLYTSTASIMTKNLNPKFFNSYSPISRKTWDNSLTCRATASTSSSSCSSIMDFDLYDLLGIDSSSDQSQIKMAYRTLQKRCHPDIAGPAGHDMAIILNEVYSVLSDPNSRLAYDKEQAKMADLRGYTGKPIYSVWFGSQNEERAVFVDEVKCVGCLKCALFAEKTFAIESVYGRARVVAQWADPEHKIQAAIETCPVDCISIVERSDLAALEFLMSKQPRGNVRVGASHTAGARVSNIFIDVKKFQTRFADATDKASSQSSKETDLQREARISAIQAIRSISNWLFWQSPKAGASGQDSLQNLTRYPSAQKSNEPDINKIREAAAARKQGRLNTRSSHRTLSNHLKYEEYWIPSTQALPASSSTFGSRAAPEASQARKSSSKVINEAAGYMVEERSRRNPMSWGIPMVNATIAAAIIGSRVEEGAVGGLNDHIGGSFALEIVNSSWLQVTLAGITWYLIGIVMIQLVEAVRNRF